MRIRAPDPSKRVALAASEAGERRAGQRFFVRLVLRTLLMLALLLLPWPGLGRHFGSAMSSLVNMTADALLAGAVSLHMIPAGPPDSWNALLTMRNADGAQQTLMWELRRTPYLPMAVFTALALASPVSRWRVRALVLCVGLVSLQVLPALRLTLLLGTDTPFRMLDLSSGAQSALVVACGALVFPPGMAYVVPASLYLLLLALIDRAALTSLVRGLRGQRALALLNAAPSNARVAHLREQRWRGSLSGPPTRKRRLRRSIKR